MKFFIFQFFNSNSEIKTLYGIVHIISLKVIILYEFNNGQISKELQRLEDHSDYVLCLNFKKESNGFVSGSLDHSIIIWDINENNQYFAKYILNDHKDNVNCLLMNKTDDLLISGSDDELIKFWRIQGGSWNCVQTIETFNYVYCLSLNELENKLICSGNGPYITIYEIQKQNQQWTLVNMIYTSQSVYRLCFTNRNQFLLQPLTMDYVEVYEMDDQYKQFSDKQQVQIKSCDHCLIGFPCQFIKQLNILTVKNGTSLNIFRISKNGTYQLIQTIEYNHRWMYGIMTGNGEYLLTWDYGSKEIQVRRLGQIE